MAIVVRKNTLGEAWVESLKLFFKSKHLHRYDSMKGPCLEIEDVIFDVLNPARLPQVSNIFPTHFHALIDDFTEKLTDKQVGHVSTTNNRLYQWSKRDGTKLDQVAKIIEALQLHPESRHCIIGFWDPDIDFFSDQPISPLVAYIRIRKGKLHSTVVARSVDAWLGAVPILVGFANLQSSLAQAVNITIGSINFHALSYHIYETDLPVVKGKLGGTI